MQTNAYNKELQQILADTSFMASKEFSQEFYKRLSKVENIPDEFINDDEDYYACSVALGIPYELERAQDIIYVQLEEEEEYVKEYEKK